MLRIQNFNFIIGKFLQKPKLLFNVLKISRGTNAPNVPPGCAPGGIYACYLVFCISWTSI